jgi:3-oxoacyl-[acyl-carrier protein] reductase
VRHTSLHKPTRPNHPFLLVGKVAVVTGSSRGTGAAVARCFGEHGASVVVNYVTDSQAADEVVQTIRSQGKGGAIAVKANTATIEGGQLLLDEAMKTFGRIDILILNSGVMGSKTLEELDEPFFDMHFETNVKVPLFMAKAAAEVMPSRECPFLFLLSTIT